MPFQVVTTGMLSPSASARTSSVASALIAPPPTTIMAASRWPAGATARWIASGSGYCRPTGRRRARSWKLTSAVSACRSHGTSMWAGPRRPVSIALKARCMMNGRSSMLLATQLRLDDRLGDLRKSVVLLAFQLLQHTAAAHVPRRPAGDDQHAGGIAVGGGQAEHGVRGAGADRGHRGHRLARDPVVAVSQMDRTLLVVGLNERDLRLVLVERIHQTPDAVTGDACHIGDPVTTCEDAGDDLPPFERRHQRPSVVGVLGCCDVAGPDRTPAQMDLAYRLEVD